MDVRPRGLAWQRAAVDQKGYVTQCQLVHQPSSFRAVGRKGHIGPSGVIEIHESVGEGQPVGADGQGLVEAAKIVGFQRFQDAIVESAAPRLPLLNTARQLPLVVEFLFSEASQVQETGSLAYRPLGLLDIAPGSHALFSEGAYSFQISTQSFQAFFRAAYFLGGNRRSQASGTRGQAIEAFLRIGYGAFGGLDILAHYRPGGKGFPRLLQACLSTLDFSTRNGQRRWGGRRSSSVRPIRPTAIRAGLR